MATEVKIKLMPGACMPTYQTAGSAGADLHALLKEPIIIEAGHRALVPTGVFLEIPADHEVQIRPRSGLALRAGITVLNSPGTIDCDYRGEIKVILQNMGQDPVTIQPNDRIAQMVLAPVTRASFHRVEELSQQGERGTGGFGHTGR